MTITLREINKDNWETVAKLSVHDEQKHFVAPNWYSMLEVIFLDSKMVSRGIYNDEELIGYAMIGQHPDDDVIFINRFMVDKAHQGKGYGRAAMEIIIESLTQQYQPEYIDITFEPENMVARKLYESFGFVNTGELEEDEMVFRLPLIK